MFYTPVQPNLNSDLSLDQWIVMV